MNQTMIYPDECYAIRGAIYEVYRELGNGFREEVYQFAAYPKAAVEQWAN